MEKGVKKRVKSLYKLVRSTIFIKSYYCLYCEMFSFDKIILEEHIKKFHDENGKIEKIYQCTKCYRQTIENKIIKHITKYH